MFKTFEYSDITLIPTKFSDIKSRSEIDTSVDFLGLRLAVPLILAPMIDVVDSNVATSAMIHGAYAILHRFQDVGQQVVDYMKSPRDIACAIGIGEEEIGRFQSLLNVGCRRFCIDVANGANTNVIQYISTLRKEAKNAGGYTGERIYFILGNFASSDQLKYVNGVDAVRLGVAGGAGCTTKNATGVHSPMGSLIYSSRKHSKKFSLIADGGIREPQDFCKALILGADVVMAGSIFASCQDSPAPVVTKSGKVYKSYSGSASETIQKRYKENVKYIEGTTRELEISNLTVSQTIQRYKQGLQSSMSYFGARSIKQFQKSLNFSLRHS